jgi:hypothetical protein
MHNTLKEVVIFYELEMDILRALVMVVHQLF